MSVCASSDACSFTVIDASCSIECIENPGERMTSAVPGTERLAVVRVRPGFWVRNGFMSQIWPSTKFNMDTMDMVR